MRNKMITSADIENIEHSIKISQNLNSSPARLKAFLPVSKLALECQKTLTHSKASVDFPSPTDISNKTYSRD